MQQPSYMIPRITVKNVSELPQSLKAEDGHTITIMPNSVTQIAAKFENSLPAGVVRKIS